MCDRRPDNTDVAAGQRIPGSKYVRAFCRECGAAMRVSKGVFDSGCYTTCADCDRPVYLCHGTSNTVDEYNGAWDNAVRALEGCA